MKGVRVVATSVASSCAQDRPLLPQRLLLQLKLL